MGSLICATVTASTMSDLRRARDRAASRADLVEVRLDSVADPDAAGAVEGRTGPVIVTCRPRWEGGSFAGSEEERGRLLRDALRAGVEYVDVEARAGFDDLVRGGDAPRIILSRHWFDGIPDDLDSQARALASTPAGTVKIAVRANRLADCLPLGTLATRCGRPASMVVVAMGEEGLATRVLAARFGSAWTYAGEGVAPGQIPLPRLLDEFRFRSLTASTALYGVVGRPIGHSVSPAMHNAAFGAEGMDAVYLPLPAADWDDFVVFARAMSLRGASVTTPYKRDAFRSADELDEIARGTGAVNTVRVDDGRVRGMNSDVAGFLAPLSGRIALAGARTVVLGAGGAARAAAVALHAAGARVDVYARRPERAAEVAAIVGGASGTLPPPAGWQLLVNATSAGMWPAVDESPVPAAALRGGLVYDLVYNPPRTRLLQEAAAAGCETIGGLEMLVAQAVEQFRWWTGRPPAAGVMRDAAEGRLAAQAREAAYAP